jgi:transcription elongation GreA/GreB family factor
MSTKPDILISSADAIALGRLLSNTSRLTHADDAQEDLSAKLVDAQIVHADALPSGTVCLQSKVTYEEVPTRTQRQVMLVDPREADPGRGRISVLSRLGRALLGQTQGSAIEVMLPAGRQLQIRVLEARAPVGEAALV